MAFDLGKTKIYGASIRETVRTKTGKEVTVHIADKLAAREAFYHANVSKIPIIENPSIPEARDHECQILRARITAVLAITDLSQETREHLEGVLTLLEQ